MPDFAIDPELRVRARPEKVLRRTSEALQFLREITPSRSSRAWQDAAESFEKIRDEWTAIEAVVSLEIIGAPRSAAAKMSGASRFHR